MTGWAGPAEPSREPERLGLIDSLAVILLPWLDPCNGGLSGVRPNRRRSDMSNDSKDDQEAEAE